MPIVDTIQEEEKYGNDGDRPFDRAIVNTLEKVSVFVNKVIEVRTFANMHCTHAYVKIHLCYVIAAAEAVK